MTRKTYRRKYSKKSRKYTRKAKKYSRKYSRKSKKGGNGDGEVNCCMCGEKVEAKLPYSLNPGKCLQEYGLRAHRICKKCWFDGPDAFANEGRNHKCPGCEKRLPLTEVPKKTEKPEEADIIDLTEE
jgi:hypothetical protein